MGPCLRSGDNIPASSAQPASDSPLKTPNLSACSDFEKTVFDLHITKRLHPDLVAEKTGKPITEILAAITALELHDLTPTTSSAR
jgi:hypothetical protein